MSTPVTPSAGRRILIVDDEQVIRHAFRRTFTRQGWAVDEAGDGAAALDLVLGPGAADYDAILCDLLMPGMSGEEFYDRVAAARPALLRRVIVTTGDTTSARAAAFLARTGCTALAKPFELAELRASVARVAGDA